MMDIMISYQILRDRYAIMSAYRRPYFTASIDLSFMRFSLEITCSLPIIDARLRLARFAVTGDEKDGILSFHSLHADIACHLSIP